MSRLDTNPYVGPRCFETEDARLFFGRQREVRELTSLVISRQAVLLYAASGTGKSSLLKAGLIPHLSFQYPSLVVLPVARVSADPPPGLAATNPATFSLLHGLLGESHTAAELAQMELGYGLGLAVEAALRGEETEAVLLIVDQFEEVFTQEPSAEAKRRAFLAALGQALRLLPRLTLLLGLREDYLAQLDPYLELFPDRLRSHFRLELLSPEAALEAITRPAEQAGVPFAPEAARALVADLGRSRSQAASGGVVEIEGAPVDPVQLQVVCRRLWAEKAGAAATLDLELVAEHGKVDDALAGFYDDQVRAVAAATAAEERWIRHWFDRELLTPQGVRKQAQREDVSTAGLPNAVVEALEDAHLVRAERRRGVVLYELAHDRLVEPVRVSNRRWSRTHQTFLEGWVRAWEGSGRNEKFLLGGKHLVAAEREVAALGSRVSGQLEEFLRAARKRERRRRRLHQRIRWVLACLSITILSLLTWKFHQSDQNQRQRFLLARTYAEVLRERDSAIDRVLLGALAAERRDATLFTQPSGHEQELPTRWLLASALEAASQLDILLHTAASPVSHLSWNTDGRRLGVGVGNGALEWWNVDAGQRARDEPAPAEGSGLASPPAAPRWLVEALGGEEPCLFVASTDGSLAVAALEGHKLQFLDFAARRLRGAAIPTPALIVTALALSADGRLLAIGDKRGAVQLFAANTFQAVDSPWRGLGEEVTALAFSPDTRRLASGHGTTVAVWQVEKRWALGESINSRESLTTPPQGQASVSLEVQARCRGDVTSSFFARGLNLRITGCGNGTLWVEEDGEKAARPVVPLAGHRAAISRLSLSASGDLLASGDSQGEIWLWDLEHLQPVAGPWRGHGEEIIALSFHPSGHTLLSQARDGSHFRWRIDLERWRERACEIANRNPTPSELESVFPILRQEDLPLCPGLPSLIEPSLP